MQKKRYLFKLFYNGLEYNGYQKQPNGNTIENHLEIAFIRSDLIVSFKLNSYKSTSRTDNKVSAIGNTFSIFCNFTPNLTRVNSYLPSDGSIVLLAYSEISINFEQYRPKFKLYAYFINSNKFSTLKNIEHIKNFTGEYDFKGFIKNNGAGGINTHTKIFDIDIEKVSSGFVVLIKGDRFGREQIRRMIGYVIDSERNNVDLNKIWGNQKQISIKPAQPESLVLVYIKYSSDLIWCSVENESFVKNRLIEYIAKYPFLAPFTNYIT